MYHFIFFHPRPKPYFNAGRGLKRLILSDFMTQLKAIATSVLQIIAVCQDFPAPARRGAARRRRVCKVMRFSVLPPGWRCEEVGHHGLRHRCRRPADIPGAPRPECTKTPCTCSRYRADGRHKTTSRRPSTYRSRTRTRSQITARF